LCKWHTLWQNLVLIQGHVHLPLYLPHSFPTHMNITQLAGWCCANPRCLAMLISWFLDKIFIYFFYLWPVDCCIYQVCHTKILCSPHIVHLCVFFYHSQNQKWFFISTDWHIWTCWSVFSAWHIASTVSISKNKKQYCTYIWNVLYYVYITICSNKNTKVTFFWNMMPCGYWHFEETFCLNLTLCLGDEGSRLLSKRRYQTTRSHSRRS
jgi:hypothetical protein